MSFVSRLPAGHEILRMRSADLLRLLNDDGHIAGGVPSALADGKQDELCRVQLETDKVLDAKESEVREIRDHCKDKIAKHKSEASRLREDREHKDV